MKVIRNSELASVCLREFGRLEISDIAERIAGAPLKDVLNFGETVDNASVSWNDWTHFEAFYPVPDFRNPHRPEGIVDEFRASRNSVLPKILALLVESYEKKPAGDYGILSLKHYWMVEKLIGDRVMVASTYAFAPKDVVKKIREDRLKEKSHVG